MPALEEETVHDYPVCRCEDVALSDVRRCLDGSPGVGLNEVKRRLRVGMGWCQGRVCGPLLAELTRTDEFLDRNRVLRPTSLAQVAQCPVASEEREGEDR